MEQFTQADIMLIEKEITRKSYRDIAFLLDRSTEDVKAFVASWIDGRGIIPFEPLSKPKREKQVPVARKPREKKVKPKEKVIESRIISRDIEQAQKQRRDRSGRPIFQTKAVDLGKMQEVRIDRKTCIYIKPGLCAETARRNYIKKLKEHKSRMLQNEL